MANDFLFMLEILLEDPFIAVGLFFITFLVLFSIFSKSVLPFFKVINILGFIAFFAVTYHSMSSKVEHRTLEFYSDSDKYLSLLEVKSISIEYEKCLRENNNPTISKKEI